MMPTRIGLLLVVLTTGLMTGCGPSNYEKNAKVAQKLVNLMDELCVVLEGVKDEASAKTAAPKIDAIATKWAAVKKEATTLLR